MAAPHRTRPERAGRHQAGHRRALTNLLFIVVGIIAIYSLLFHFFMAQEGRSYSWLSGVYWTLQTMMTLGYGDITFTSDPGHAFAMVVLITGVVLLFVLLPFTLIQFLYAPWLEARNAARTPRALPDGTAG